MGHSTYTVPFGPMMLRVIGQYINTQRLYKRIEIQLELFSAVPMCVILNGHDKHKGKS